MFEPLPMQIREARESQGLSQLALANSAGVSRTAIVQLEKGEDNVSLGVLLKVARALSLSRLYVQELSVDAPPPDLSVLLAAREAIAAAEEVADHAIASRERLRHHAEVVSSLLHRTYEAETVADTGVGQAARRLAARTDARSTARALRDLAESRDAIPSRSARPKPAAKAASRKQGR